MALGPQIGKSREGYPVYRFTDSRTKRETYVVVLPDQRAYYSDANGKLVATPVDANSPIAAAVLGGMVGFGIGGPVGAMVGALIGAIAADQLAKKDS